MLPAAAFQLDSLQNFISQQCITTKLYMYYVLILEKSDKRNISSLRPICFSMEKVIDLAKAFDMIHETDGKGH